MYMLLLYYSHPVNAHDSPPKPQHTLPSPALRRAHLQSRRPPLVIAGIPHLATSDDPGRLLSDIADHDDGSLEFATHAVRANAAAGRGQQAGDREKLPVRTSEMSALPRAGSVSQFAYGRVETHQTGIVRPRQHPLP